MHLVRSLKTPLSIAIATSITFLLIGPDSSAAEATATESHGDYAVNVAITTPLVHENVPLDPEINFGELITTLGIQGVLDPASIQVIDVTAGEPIPHALGDDFAYGDRGRIEWVAPDPAHTEYEIRFSVAATRPHPVEQAYVPPIGTGDLLRFNAGTARPVTLFNSMGLHDMTGDGRADLVGTWNYARRPGRPWSGVVSHPATGDELLFGHLCRFRYRTADAEDDWRLFAGVYVSADFADFNQDGLLDLVTTSSQSSDAAFYLNTGSNDPSHLPRFEEAGTTPVDGWSPCRAVDLDQDGNVDLVINGQFIRNTSENGWPFQAAPRVPLDAGREPCFLDLDGDELLDAVCLLGNDTVQPDGYRVAWKRNLGGNPPRFGEERQLEDIDVPFVTMVAAADTHPRPRLLVQHDVYQKISLFELVQPDVEEPEFEFIGPLQSLSAVMSFSDQAWPTFCDWDNDGDLDMLVGGGYGWPRIVINEGSPTRPAFAEPAPILSDGEPIRILRNEILGPPDNWHDMGYCYPAFIDWDADGVPDLLLPNETNRILWYRNVGSAESPAFGPRQQILCEDFPDSDTQRAQSARRAIDPNSNNGVYPLEPERPFFWRTGAAFADWNGDGLTDFITHDGATRQATLFVQFRDSDGGLRLRKEHAVQLNDGRPIDDRIVNRSAHWTESFRPVDWDGDGLTDLVYSIAGAHNGALDGGSIYLLRNCGTRESPQFEPPRTMRCFGEPIRVTNHGPHPWVGDFDGDDKPDIVACVEWSVYPWYSHAALTMSARPEFTLSEPRRIE